MIGIGDVYVGFEFDGWLIEGFWFELGEYECVVYVLLIEVGVDCCVVFVEWVEKEECVLI